MIQTSNPNLFGFNYGSIEGKNCGRLITILDPKLGRGGGNCQQKVWTNSMLDHFWKTKLCTMKKVVEQF